MTKILGVAFNHNDYYPNIGIALFPRHGEDIIELELTVEAYNMLKGKFTLEGDDD